MAPTPMKTCGGIYLRSKIQSVNACILQWISFRLTGLDDTIGKLVLRANKREREIEKWRKG